MRLSIFEICIYKSGILYEKLTDPYLSSAQAVCRLY